MKKNNKGFTLVELLAVIVIMGILMMVAIPSVTRTIENSRKDTFVDIAKSYGNAVRTLWTSDNLICNGVVSSAVDDGDYYILINSKSGAKESLPTLVDQGGKSSWGNRDVNGYVRVNVSTTPGEDANSDGIYEVEPRRVTKFYVALSDGTHGLVDDDTLMMDELKRGNVVMSLSSEQVKKVELTVGDGRLDCAVDTDGTYYCTAVNPIKNITGICVDEQTNVGITGNVQGNPMNDDLLVYNAFYKFSSGSYYQWLYLTNSSVYGYITNDSNIGLQVSKEINDDKITIKYQGSVIAEATISPDGKSLVALDENNIPITFVLDESSKEKFSLMWFKEDDIEIFIAYEKGTTWQEHLNSLYGSYGSDWVIDDNGYIFVNDVEGHVTYNDGTLVKATDLIIENYHSYHYEHDLS